MQICTGVWATRIRFGNPVPRPGPRDGARGPRRGARQAGARSGPGLPHGAHSSTLCANVQHSRGMFCYLRRMTNKKSKRRPTQRVTATVPVEVLEVWRETAAVEDKSVSRLMAEWMEELTPALRDVARLRAAYVAADTAQKAALRAAVASAGQEAQETLLGAWKPMQDLLPGDQS